MLKTKLLILLLISGILSSCLKKDYNNQNIKYSIAYIGGNYDGLLLRNILVSHLQSFQEYDQRSPYKINAEIDHNESLFITNIDNTSDRTNIITDLKVIVIDENSKCVVFEETLSTNQFFIFASGDKFLSNNTAVKKIKKDNTEALVKSFINRLKRVELSCDN